MSKRRHRRHPALIEFQGHALNFQAQVFAALRDDRRNDSTWIRRRPDAVTGGRSAPRLK